MNTSLSTASEPDLGAVAAKPATDTWRYFGDREAADRAYCARFDVQAAPEPVRVVGGIWAYTLPSQRTSR